MDQSLERRFDEDSVLVERFLTGDSTAFDVLYHRYYEKVYQIALGILIRSDEAADTVQEIFTLVFRHISKFNRKSRFSTWVFRIAVNRSIQQSRSNRYMKRETELKEADHVATESTGFVHDPQIAKALEQLAPDDRAVITLFYWEDLSLAEISESLHCSANAAKTRLFRARDRFKKFYEEVQ